MKWPEASKLIEKSRQERPELTVDSFPSSATDHVILRLYCINKGLGSDSRHLIRESVDTIHGVERWQRYQERHPELDFCPFVGLIVAKPQDERGFSTFATPSFTVGGAKSHLDWR